MNITKEQTGELTATLKVEVKESDYNADYQQELKKYARQSVIPGFRPGKVPVGMIEKKYGTAIRADSINKLLNEKLTEYIKEEKLNILGEPIPNSEKGKIDFERQKDFDFYFDICNIPEINIELNASIELDFFQIKPTDEQVNKQLEHLRVMYGKEVEVEMVESDTKVDIELRELNDEGEVVEDGIFSTCNVLINQYSAAYATERLTGKKAEDVLTVNPIELFGDLKSAADKMAVDKSKLEDKPDSFELKIIKIQRRELAELNQEFFDKAFHEKGVSDVDSAKQEVEKQMQEYFSNDGQFVLYNDFIQWMFDNTKINLPDDFLRKWLHSINENKLSMEEIDKELVNVKNKLQTEIIFNKLKENYPQIEVNYDEVKESFKQQFKKVLKVYSNYGDEEADKEVESFIDEWMRNKKNNNEIENRFQQLHQEKVLDLIRNKCTIKEIGVTFDEFNNIMKERKRDTLSENDSASHHDDEEHHDHEHSEPESENDQE